MRIVMVLLVLFSLIYRVDAQTLDTFKLDQKDPVSVVNAVFYAAKSGGFEMLEPLSDPEGYGGRDTKLLLMLSDTSVENERTINLFLSEAGDQYKGVPEEEIKRIVKQIILDSRRGYFDLFSNGKISGAPEFFMGTEGEPNTPSAYVPVRLSSEDRLTDYDGSIHLIQRDEKWFLISFR